MPINQPSNQIKLTNVSLVKMKKGKKRFEIACYKNKVLEYRNGVETDLDEVLQIHQVFTNVSKGAVAPHADLEKAFPKMPLADIILEILKKGELQVGEKERGAQLEQKYNEVVQIVTGKCVDPGSGRPYTTGMIEKALAELSTKGGHAGEEKDQAAHSASHPTHSEKGKEKEEIKDEPRWTGVTTSKSAKSQALEAIKALVYFQPIPISRARMKLRVFLPSAAKKFVQVVKDMCEEVVDEDAGGDGWTGEVMCEPGKYRDIGDLIATETKGKGRVEVLEMAVVVGDDDR